jgi:hypothetical protein
MARPESVPDGGSPYEREWHDTGAAPLLTDLYGDLTQVVLPADRRQADTCVWVEMARA